MKYVPVIQLSTTVEPKYIASTANVLLQITRYSHCLRNRHSRLIRERHDKGMSSTEPPHFVTNLGRVVD